MSDEMQDVADEGQDELPPTLDLALDKPIKFKGVEFHLLELREPTAGEVQRAESHLRAAVNPETMRRHDIALVSAVSGMPEPAVLALPISKLNQAVAYLVGFLVAGRATGKSSSPS